MAKELSGIRNNVAYLKTKDGEMKPHIEMILVVSEPQYEMTNTGEVAQSRQSESLRFSTYPKGLIFLRKYITTVLEDLDEKGEIALADLEAEYETETS